MNEACLLTIAGNNQELVVLVDVVDLNVWKGSDYLLLGWEVGALLELKIAYRARQRKVAVDTAKVDEAASCLDACLFG
ncbi:Protein phosphatase 2C isoform gamma [Pyrenophora tritici-repentis]|nr:Protein phosphatase 2C isoform gamma [Pyrenophora tritici-repentis]